VVVNSQVTVFRGPHDVAGTLAAADVFLTDPHVRSALEQGASASLAFMSIGAPRQDSVLIRQGTIVEWEELAELQQQGAVGDINLGYFGGDGQLVASDLDRRVIGLMLDAIQRINTVAGVAGGAAKLKAIQGALEGRLVNVLVTDRLTGKRLLAEVSA
jgi:DNA-binding transcriptional regulator LsrR (DeoR family)